MLSADSSGTKIQIGDTLRVHSTVVEGAKTRIQVFEGILISLSGRGENKTMTVRRIGAGQVGIERKWPVDARSIVKVEVKRNATKVRRSKLYYLRELTGRQATRV